MVSSVIPVQSFDLVIFGATGDLARRKILPSLYRRLAVRQMPETARVIGAARSKMSRADFRKETAAALAEFVEPNLLKPDLVEKFLASVDYVTVDATGQDGWAQLAKKLGEKGKLPGAAISQEYALEYGTNTIEMHVDAIAPGERAYVVDDLLATGGTAAATARLIERLRGEICAFGFLVELEFLEGRKNLLGYQVDSLITY